jgi:hypothetical protein
MNYRKKCTLTLFCICLILSSLLMATCCAQGSGVSITNVNAVLLKTRTVGNRVIHYYRIIVTLQNSGNTKTDELSVKFYDPEYNASTTPPLVLSPANYSLKPGESKMFNISEWPTPLTGDVPLNISFSPISPTILNDDTNSGYYLYTLNIAGGTTKQTSTPGFEIGIVLVAIIVLLASRKKVR